MVVVFICDDKGPRPSTFCLHCKVRLRALDRSVRSREGATTTPTTGTRPSKGYRL